MKCKNCFYWRKLDPTIPSAGKCCHYILMEYKCRLRDGDNCLSYKPKEVDKNQQATL